MLGDQDATDEIKRHAASQDVRESLHGQTAEFAVRWLQAGKNVDEQTKVVNDLETLDKAHLDSALLTLYTASLIDDTDSPELSTRLEKLATETMKSPVIEEIKVELQEMKAQKAEMDSMLASLRLMENKPIDIKGKTVDGKDFNIADWKGKVVLIDFWATWCGPCVAELPLIKKVYADNHDKGFEIVGISNDSDADTLTKFTKANLMPWPQLFDPTAGAANNWNPVTMAMGVKAIPVLFIVDKKGVLRSVSGREKMQELIPKLLAE